jgi:hypothetical protein
MSTPPWGQDPQQQPDGSGGQAPYQPYGTPDPYGQQPYPVPYAAPAQTNGMAIASLVVSIVSLTACCGLTGIVGAILGHVSRKQIRERNEGGAGMALAGVIIGWIGFGIALLVIAFYAIIFIIAANDPNCSTSDADYPFC